MSGFDDYDEFDGLGLAELVSSGKVSAEALLEEAISRVETINPHLNAVVGRFDDAARQAIAAGLPDGPFQGVPVLIKDLLSHIAGEPTSAGSRFLSRTTQPADNSLVQRMRDAGFVLFGKTTTPEFGLKLNTEPLLWGPTRNPWDLERTPGGSSGGAAAVVSAGIIPMAAGSDAGGSIRIPSSFTGLFGLKPSRGRVALSPNLGGCWHGALQEHVLTRSVRDSAALLDAVHGARPGAPFHAPPPKGRFLDAVASPPPALRMAVMYEPVIESGPLDPECKAAVTAAVELCRELGHTVVEKRPNVDSENFPEDFLMSTLAELAADISQAESLVGRPAAADDLELATRLGRLIAKKASAVDLAIAQQRLFGFADHMHEFMADVDVILTPTSACMPPAHGHLQLVGIEAVLARMIAALDAGRILAWSGAVDQLVKDTFEMISFTSIYNVSGQPAMSVPLHWTPEGLPVGVQFAGRFGDEETLFSLAGQLEIARPWSNRFPPLHASNINK